MPYKVTIETAKHLISEGHDTRNLEAVAMADAFTEAQAQADENGGRVVLWMRSDIFTTDPWTRVKAFTPSRFALAQWKAFQAQRGAFGTYHGTRWVPARKVA